MEGKISVIVPVYNAEKFLKRCVDSILNQTYQNIELILVNDGSKDNSLEICKEIAEKDSRVKVLDKPNGGAASARNLGLDNATGEYIGFCDADDYLDVNMYDILQKTLEEKNLDVVDANAKVFDEDGNYLYEDTDKEKFRLILSFDYIRNIFLRKGNVHLATKLFKSDLIKNIRIPEGRRVEDFYFTICYLLRTNQVGHVSDALYNYTVNSNSVTHKATGSIYLDALYFYDLALKLLGNLNDSLAVEQKYYLLKMFYLLSISITGDERKQYADELKVCQESIRRNRREIKKNPYLKKKEKLMLYISCFSMKLSRMLFCLKGGEKK